MTDSLQCHHHSSRNAQPRFELNKARRALIIGEGLSVTLSRLEFTFLDLLFTNAGRVVDYDATAQVLWGNGKLGPSAVKSRLKSLVRRLREKLGSDMEAIDVIISVRGRGYLVEGDVVATTAREGESHEVTSPGASSV